jgi:hypothetical protein
LLGGALAPASTGADQHDHADPHGHEHKSADPAEALSPELRQLFVKEMRLIDDAMGDLLSAIAGKIQHSFILKQQLTEPQLHELHEKLPADFVQMDVRFHGTAGKLAATSPHRDAELAGFYYSRLVDGCVGCHAAFAPGRFPGLAAQESSDHH